MEKEERIRACYLHACLKYVNGEFMNNSSLRERFGIEVKNSSFATRIIKDTIEADLVKIHNEETAPRYMKYVPYWA